MGKLLGISLGLGGMILFLGWGIIGLFVIFSVVYSAFGLLGVLIGMFIFPVTIFLTPIYAIINSGNWLPALFAYLPVIIISLLSAKGNSKDN